MIKQESIQRVLDASRVEEVLGDFLNVRKRGSSYLANCPFHEEKTPSFSISPAKGLYKCFGCGKAGTSVTFLMDYEKLAYVDAIKYLAKKYGIAIEETEQTAVEVEKRNLKDSLMIVNEYAAKQFSFYLNETEEGRAIGKTYFEERGFSEKTIKEFQLGYCLDTWDSFSNQALKDGYNKDFLIQLGLSKENEKGTLRDFFKGRVIFPIHNLVGKPIGFGARILNTSEKAAKYLNSPENEIYHKSQVLYGMHIAKKSIPKENYCILVEGYTDVISLYQAGIENVVSSSGTALTIDQTKLVRRFTENLYILFDGDNAGIKAALRGLEIALESGLNVKLILLPPTHDPDSYVKLHGGQKLKEYIETEARDIVTFKANLYKEEAGNDPIKKAELVRDIINTISIVSDNIKRSFYIKECAILLDIDENLLARETQKIIVNKKVKSSKVHTESNIPETTNYNNELIDEINNLESHKSSLILAEKELCKILLEYGDKEIEIDDNPFIEPISVLNYIFNNMLINFEFESEILKKVFHTIKDEFLNGNIQKPQYYCNFPDQEVSQFAINIITSNIEPLHTWNKNDNSIKVTKYGEKYTKEIKDVLKKVEKEYLEKLSKHILEVTTNEINNNNNDFNEITLRQMNIQNEFRLYFKKISEGEQNVFRKY